MTLDDYIPHRPPMRLVEQLVDSDEHRVVVSAQVRPDNPFFDTRRGGVPAWVGLEYMAQTAAVWVGLEDERRQRPVEPAFLISSREYQAFEPVLAEGESLTVTVYAQMIEGPLVSFSGTISNREGAVLAEAVFTAYRPDDIDAYLRDSKPESTTGDR